MRSLNQGTAPAALVALLATISVAGVAAIASSPAPGGQRTVPATASVQSPSAAVPAVSNIRSHVTASPHAAGSHHGAAVGDEDEAAARPGPLMDPNESITDYLWRKSDVAFHAGDYDRAIQLHKAIEISDPSDTQSFGVCAWLMWSMGNGPEAIAHIKRGLAANPNSWEMWNEAGEQYDLQKQYTNAKDAYAHAVALIDKNNDESQMLSRRLAHAAEHGGDLALATATWQALVADYPKEVVNKNNLARVQSLKK